MCRPKIVISIAAIVIATGCASTARREPTTPILSPSGDILDAYASILRAEDRRDGESGLRSMFADPRAEIRARAALAAGRIDYPDAAADLEPLLADDDAAVRGGAVLALGLMGAADHAPAVAALIDDPDAGVRAHVARSLGWMGEGNRVEPLLRDADTGVAAAACLQVPESPAAIEALLDSSASADSGVAFAAAYALARLAGTRDDGAVSEDDRRRIRSRLANLVTHEDGEVRMQVALGLSVPEDHDERSTLVTLVEDPDYRVRVNAVAALGYAGGTLDPVFGRAVRDGSRQVVAATFGALGRIATNQSIALLLQGAGPRHPPWVRVHAIEALGKADDRTLLSLAPRYLRDSAPRLGAAALRGLVGRTDENTLDLFRKRLDDDHPDTQAAAIEGLAAAGVAPDELDAAARSADPVVRAAVARALGRWYLTAAERPTRAAGLRMLSEIWTRSADDEIAAARLAVLDAAGSKGAQEGSGPRMILENGLGDPDWRVRHRAARLLEDVFGIDASKRVGPATDLPLEHYREIVAWAQTPRAAVVTIRRPTFRPGRFTVALDVDHAPLTSWNFAKLAQERSFDGVPVFRLELRRVFLTGDPRGDGYGGPGYSLPGESGSLASGAGLLGMARGEGGGHGSQWFATLSEQPELDGRFTIFGRVVQNLPGVVQLIEPDDVVVSIRMYEGDGTEPLPPMSER